jgi:hypothetical protein
MTASAELLNTELHNDYRPFLPCDNIAKQTDSQFKGKLSLQSPIPQETSWSEEKGLRSVKSRLQDNIAVSSEKKLGLKSSVDGAVINVVDRSVSCELFTQPKHRFINMPISMFPEVEKIKIGQGITLRIEKVLGIKKPIINFREIDPEKSKDGVDFFDSFQF